MLSVFIFRFQLHIQVAGQRIQRFVGQRQPSFLDGVPELLPHGRRRAVSHERDQLLTVDQLIREGIDQVLAEICHGGPDIIHDHVADRTRAGSLPGIAGALALCACPLPGIAGALALGACSGRPRPGRACCLADLIERMSGQRHQFGVDGRLHPVLDRLERGIHRALQVRCDQLGVKILS